MLTEKPPESRHIPVVLVARHAADRIPRCPQDQPKLRLADLLPPLLQTRPLAHDLTIVSAILRGTFASLAQPTVLVASSIAFVEMNEDVRQLAADSGVLRHVAGRRFESGYELIELAFEHGTLRLTCNGDTDEIVVASSERTDQFDEIVNDDSASSKLQLRLSPSLT